jgi:hypothetical protein
MRRRWIIAGLPVCILAALLAIVASWHEREPVYKGHPLSWWTEGNAGPVWARGVGASLRTRPQKYEVVAAIGTNGLPFYLKWIQYHPSPWEVRAREIIRKLPPWFQRFSIAQSILSDEKPLLRAEGAANAFQTLGPGAAPAVPELTRLMNDPLHPAVAARAIAALGPIGDDAVMPLLTCLTNVNRDTQLRNVIQHSLLRAAYVSTNASDAVPVLIPLVRNMDTLTALTAIELLGTLHLRPDLAVPVLTEAVLHARADMREHAAAALGQFGTNAMPALRALEKAADDPDPVVADAAKAAIVKIAPETHWDVGQELHGR